MIKSLIPVINLTEINKLNFIVKNPTKERSINTLKKVV